jgi:ABC-2 type transport system ATP-binding protein
MSEKLAVSIRGLSKHYGKALAVDQLDLEIRAGEIFGLLGPNGAGKSTTIHLITGIARVETGQISVFGRDVVKEFEWTRRNIGMMHQEVFPDNFFPLDRALKLHAGYYGFPDDPIWRETLIDRLGLRPHLKKKMLQLSGGLKRRFALAKALIHKPRLLILDEPTAGVDVELRLTLWEFVRDLNASGTTVLLTTHYLEEAEKLCGRIGIMNGGKLIALDETHKLVKQIEDRELILRIANPQVLTSELLELGGQKTHRPEEIRFLLKRDQRVSQILDVVRKNGLEIQDLEMKSSNLEDVFLKLTEMRSQP